MQTGSSYDGSQEAAFPSQNSQPSSHFDNSRFRKVNAYGDQDKDPRSGAEVYGAGYSSSVGNNYAATGGAGRTSYDSGRRSGEDRFRSGAGYGNPQHDAIPARDSHVPHVVMDDLDEVNSDGSYFRHLSCIILCRI